MLSGGVLSLRTLYNWLLILYFIIICSTEVMKTYLMSVGREFPNGLSRRSWLVTLMAEHLLALAFTTSDLQLCVISKSYTLVS
jgi:hypothetical protein